MDDEKRNPGPVRPARRPGGRPPAERAPKPQRFPVTDPELDQALTRAGFESPEKLAQAHPERLRLILADEAVEMAPRQVSELVARAQGHALPSEVIDYPSVMHELPSQALDQVKRLDFTGLEPKRDDALERMLAVRRARGIMQAAGVDELESLGPLSVEARRELGPGTYLGRPSNASRPGGQSFEDDLIRRARAQNTVTVLPDSLHLLPRKPTRSGGPVTEAVILGSVLEFVRDGQLVLASDLSSLVIITQRLDYQRLTRISYVFFDVPPATRQSDLPERATDATRWDRDHFTQVSEDSNSGADGHRGTDAAQDTLPGHAGPPAPDLTLYVLETPGGLPDIELSGRPGGRGAKGQDGGHGGDGARGRPSKTELMWCKRGVGHGGRGGDGGTGGPGGDGGKGGRGGEVKIFTLLENFQALLSRDDLDINIAGGLGGAPGEPGKGGDPGQGGKAGEPSWQCPHEPEREGKPGAAGASGAEGSPGEPGERGSSRIQLLTTADWEAIYESPWIETLDPWWATVGETVTVHAVNLTPDAKLRLDGAISTVSSPSWALMFMPPVSALASMVSALFEVMICSMSTNDPAPE
ncbi:MAG: hypothetical protein AAF560_33580, partial [Acidobacteriota bacterium]